MIQVVPNLYCSGAAEHRQQYSDPTFHNVLLSRAAAKIPSY